jgi:hypothetical protein
VRFLYRDNGHVHLRFIFTPWITLRRRGRACIATSDARKATSWPRGWLSAGELRLEPPGIALTVKELFPLP